MESTHPQRALPDPSPVQTNQVSMLPIPLSTHGFAEGLSRVLPFQDDVSSV